MSDDEAADPRYDLLDLSNAIGRFGVAYFTNICAQAHLGFSEKRPGEDNLALDGSIDYQKAPVRVQIKATTQWALSGLIRKSFGGYAAVVSAAGW